MFEVSSQYESWSYLERRGLRTICKWVIVYDEDLTPNLTLDLTLDSTLDSTLEMMLELTLDSTLNTRVHDDVLIWPAVMTNVKP
jgi:hypothetical protein